MEDTVSPKIEVVVSDNITGFFTNKWFQAFRHALPLTLLLSIGIYLGFPTFGNEYLILVPVLVALCTTVTRYGARVIATRFGNKKNERSLLRLTGNDLYFNLDSIECHVNLNDCQEIRVYRALWWLSPFIVFAIKRNDGYERRVLTYIDTPEVYTALKRINEEIDSEKQNDTRSFPQ